MQQLYCIPRLILIPLLSLNINLLVLLTTITLGISSLSIHKVSADSSPTALNKTINIVQLDPYSVSFAFERAAYNDQNLAHTKYEIKIVKEDGLTSAKTLSSQNIQPYKVDKVKSMQENKVYTDVSLNNVVPGKYIIKITPYGKAEGSCWVHCNNQPLASRRYISAVFTITGADYKPPFSPKLELLEQNLTIVIPVAPLNYHISQTISVTLQRINGRPTNVTKYIKIQSGNDSWSEQRVPLDDVLSQYNAGDQLQATIAVSSSAGLCKSSDHQFNYNGTCVTLSNAQTNSITILAADDSIKPNPKHQKSLTDQEKQYIGGAVGAFLGLCIILTVTSMYIAYEKQQVKRRKTSEESLIPEDCEDNVSQFTGGDSTWAFGSKSQRVCIVHINGLPGYEELARKLKDALSTHFGIDISIYTGGVGEPNDPACYAGFVIVLDSVELSLACAKLIPHETVSVIAERVKGAPEPQQTVQRSDFCAANIINFLTNESLAVQSVALATFEHLGHASNKHGGLCFSQRRKGVKKFLVPKKFEELMKYVMTEGIHQDKPVEITTWPQYLSSDEKVYLDSAIANLTHVQTASNSDDASLNNLKVNNTASAAIKGGPKVNEVTDYTSCGTGASSYACSEPEYDSNYFTISV